MPAARGVHTLRVKLEAGNDRVYRSPDFEAAGNWHLQIYAPDSTRPRVLGIYLHASHTDRDEPGTRDDVICSFKIINFAKIKKSCRGIYKFVSGSAGQYMGSIDYDSLCHPTAGFVDNKQCLHLLVEITARAGAPKAQSAGEGFDSPGIKLDSAPQASLSGNTVIVLDSGISLLAHSIYLEQASEVFQGALECLQPAADALRSRPEFASGSPHITHRLPMPGVSMHQALLLLHCLYAWARESWAASLTMKDLCDLARIADRFACHSALHMVDETMLRLAVAHEDSPPDAALGGAVLTAASAPEQHRLAQELNLRRYRLHVEFFMGMHASEMNLTQVGEEHAEVLRGASKMRAELLASLLPA